MLQRLFAAVVVGILAAGFTVGPLVGGDKDKVDVKDAKNVLTGKIGEVKGKTFTLDAKAKLHRLTLAPTGKVVDPAGKECDLEDLKKGQMVRVTTKAGDATTAIRVEAQKAKGIGTKKAPR